MTMVLPKQCIERDSVGRIGCVINIHLPPSTQTGRGGSPGHRPYWAHLLG